MNEKQQKPREEKEHLKKQQDSLSDSERIKYIFLFLEEKHLKYL